ncbi:hypothetical protein ACLFLC_14590 [Providencia rettgeri]
MIFYTWENISFDTSNIATIEMIKISIADNETSTKNNSTHVFHDSVSNGTMTTKNIFHLIVPPL